MSGFDLASSFHNSASGSVCDVPACRSKQEGKQQELVWSSSQQVLRRESQVLRPTYDGTLIADTGSQITSVSPERNGSVV